MSKTVHFYGPAVTVPLIMASFGFRPRSAAVLVTMVASSAMTIYRIYYKAQVISQRNVFESLIFSFIVLLVAYYLLPKLPNTGWIGIKDRSAVELQNQETKRWWMQQWYKFKTLLTKEYRKGLFPKKEGAFVALGAYFIFSTLLSLCFMQKDYLFPYIYWYMAVMAIGTILVIYPSFDVYRRKPNFTYFVWPVVLFMLLFVSNIQFAKLGCFGPMVCALLICNLAASIAFFSLSVSMGMLVIAMVLHKFIPPSIPFWGLLHWATLEQQITWELVAAGVLTGVSLSGFGIYKYLRNKADIKSKIVELARAYECRVSLEAIYNEANWHKLDLTHSSEMLKEVGKMLEGPCQYLYANKQEKLGEEVNIFIQKVGEFSSLLLQRAKEARNLVLSKKSVKSIAIESVIRKARPLQFISKLLQVILVVFFS